MLTGVLKPPSRSPRPPRSGQQKAQCRRWAVMSAHACLLQALLGFSGDTKHCPARSSDLDNLATSGPETTARQLLHTGSGPGGILSKERTLSSDVSHCGPSLSCLVWGREASVSVALLSSSKHILKSEYTRERTLPLPPPPYFQRPPFSTPG